MNPILLLAGAFLAYKFYEGQKASTGQLPPNAMPGLPHTQAGIPTTQAVNMSPLEVAKAAQAELERLSTTMMAPSTRGSFTMPSFLPGGNVPR